MWFDFFMFLTDIEKFVRIIRSIKNQGLVSPTIDYTKKDHLDNYNFVTVFGFKSLRVQMIATKNGYV